MSLKKICASVKKYNNFLITVHTSPEGDALGAELAFYNLIKKLGKSAVIINEDALPYGYDFLPGNELILRPGRETKHINFADFDCFVVLDCADLKRTGSVYKLNTGNDPILNIDHHISNRNFGSVNWVESAASSCSEMIYRLYKRLRLPIDKETALLLYTGIMTDTGSFRYSNTSAFTHKAVAGLLGSGLDVVQVYRNTYENIPQSDIRLLLKVLPEIRFYCRGRIAWFMIKKELLKFGKPRVDLADLLLSFGRQIKGVEVVALFKENLGENDEVRVNLRSQGQVDVNMVASFFGGGGHKTAAGCTLHGELSTVCRKVITKICQSLK